MIQDVCEERKDCFGVVDPPFGLTVQGVIKWHNGEDPETRTKKLDSQYEHIVVLQSSKKFQHLE